MTETSIDPARDHALVRGTPHAGPSTTLIRAAHLREPLLAFAGKRQHVDPKTGIARYGPASLASPGHPATIRIGYVGSGPSIASAQKLVERYAKGVSGSSDEKLQDFPGCTRDRGFFTELMHSQRLAQSITLHDLRGLKQIKRLSERFNAAVQLFSDKVRLLAQQDERPDVIVLALPAELVEKVGSVRIRHPQRGLLVRNLRRALKAELMRHGVPTQIILERTADAEPGARNIDPPSRVAWNLFTGLFYKGGGTPWNPVGLRPDTCYIGVSFHRGLASTDPTIRTSVAQAFDDYGVGLVLRGPDFPWDEQQLGRSPHLDAEKAAQLLGLVLRRYRQETGRAPAHVVVHKTSRYWPAEREGIQDALRDVSRFDLVAVTPISEVRLVRTGKYPPLRGTLFSVGDIRYLYTTGWIPYLQAYPHGHVPAPLQIADHHGDSSIDTLAHEILILTKMNWNSAGFAGALPITIRFSRRVGEIMREIPPDREPHPSFKFYT